MHIVREGLKKTANYPQFVDKGGGVGPQMWKRDGGGEGRSLHVDKQILLISKKWISSEGGGDNVDNVF